MTQQRKTSVDAKGNRAEVVAMLGVSVKALRLYEKLGMVAPPRNKRGRRVYGDAELVRLQAILALKQSGMTITRIATFLKSKPDELGRLLTEHLDTLLQRRRDADFAIRHLEMARHALERGVLQSPEGIGSFLRRADKSVIRQTSATYPIIEKLFTPDQIQSVLLRDVPVEEAVAHGDELARVQAEVRRLAPGGDPASPEALDMARRMDRLIEIMSGGDADVRARAHAFWVEAFKHPATAAALPLTRPQWEFMNAALAELIRRRKAQAGDRGA